MRMIASVLHLDRAAIRALRITDPYSVHRVVYSLYPDVRSASDKASSRASGLLYADQGGDFQGRRILLLADRMPADAIDGRYGIVQSKALHDDFLGHLDYRFKVIVNPTRRDNVSGRLVPVKGRALIAEWFTARAMASWGFQVAEDSLQVDRVEVLQFKDKQQNAVTMAQAHLQGRLRVTDRTSFHRSFCQGIGRGRAFGCGLLQIVPCLNQ